TVLLLRSRGRRDGGAGQVHVAHTGCLDLSHRSLFGAQGKRRSADGAREPFGRHLICSPMMMTAPAFYDPMLPEPLQAAAPVPGVSQPSNHRGFVAAIARPAVRRRPPG